MFWSMSWCILFYLSLLEHDIVVFFLWCFFPGFHFIGLKKLGKMFLYFHILRIPILNNPGNGCWRSSMMILLITSAESLRAIAVRKATKIFQNHVLCSENATYIFHYTTICRSYISCEIQRQYWTSKIHTATRQAATQRGPGEGKIGVCFPPYPLEGLPQPALVRACKWQHNLVGLLGKRRTCSSSQPCVPFMESIMKWLGQILF